MASLNSNMFTVAGTGQDKDMTELMPGILSQMGPDALNSLRKLAETYTKMGGQAAAGAEDDEAVPELVENFEEVADKE